MVDLRTMTLSVEECGRGSSFNDCGFLSSSASHDVETIISRFWRCNNEAVQALNDSDSFRLDSTPDSHLF